MELTEAWVRGHHPRLGDRGVPRARNRALRLPLQGDGGGPAAVDLVLAWQSFIGGPAAAESLVPAATYFCLFFCSLSVYRKIIPWIPTSNLKLQGIHIALVALPQR
jgi:hypothetical protein